MRFITLFQGSKHTQNRKYVLKTKVFKSNKNTSYHQFNFASPVICLNLQVGTSYLSVGR